MDESKVELYNLQVFSTELDFDENAQFKWIHLFLKPQHSHPQATIFMENAGFCEKMHSLNFLYCG